MITQDKRKLSLYKKGTDNIGRHLKHLASLQKDDLCVSRAEKSLVPMVTDRNECLCPVFALSSGYVCLVKGTF